MTSATFPPEVGGDGSTVSDDSNPTTGLGNGGHRTRFVPALGQVVAVAQWVVAKAQEVASLALNILNAPATSATSSSSLTLAGSGTLNFTLDQMDKAFMAGMTVGFARTSNPDEQMIVLLTAFTPATGVGQGTIVSSTTTGGPYSGWNVFRTASGGIPATRSITFNFGASLIAAGTLAADIVITLGKATAAEIAAGLDDLKAITSKGLTDSMAPQVLTDQATIQWDMSQRQSAMVTLGGNRTLNKPTNYKRGVTYDIEVWQDATGGRTLAFHACYEFGAQGVPIVSSGANKMTLITMRCIDDDATNPRFRCAANMDAP
ncbi:hypothetical protein [Phenylobacterium koreense]|uniref:Uncharacterized protein n=1 Tax=Phenylobacterium koreense TaxID=266125 RepID=A0ABV2EJQ0_9CAUL